MIHTPPQHQADPDKLPGQVVNSDYKCLGERVTAHEVAQWKERRFGVRLGEITVTDAASYKPAHGGYPGEVKRA